MPTQTFIIPPGSSGGRLDVVLAAVSGMSRSQAQRMCRETRVVVDGHPAQARYVVKGGELVEVTIPSTAVVEAPKLEVVYQDDDVLVVNKPAGMNTHPGNGRRSEPTVADFAREYTNDDDPERPGIVHRLDRDTSGLLVIARTLEAKSWLQDSWRERAVEKRYTALVDGHLEPTEALISRPLERDPIHRERRRVAGGGRSAQTRYHVLSGLGGYDLIEAFPLTGRTHQIRVHLASVGHPVTGDTLYGNPKRALGLTRQFLHASGLVFMLPSGKRLALDCPIPDDLEQVLRRLGRGL